MKPCRYCGKTYSETDFGVAKTTPTKTYRRQKCRFCYRETKNKLKAARKGWIEVYKSEKGCVRCKTTDPRVLEFHHIDTKKKEFNIADYYYTQYSVEKLDKEIKKCLVICANCHRILHAEERNRL
jgi:hypothetical protein